MISFHLKIFFPKTLQILETVVPSGAIFPNAAEQEPGM